jgi:uncharacterized Rmd1/YagE family protein
MSMQKEITIVFYNFRLTQPDWKPDDVERSRDDFIAELCGELEPLGISVVCHEEPENVLEVAGYGDLLNTVRLRSPKDHIGNLCLGHIVGQSVNCDLYEDIRRGVNRVAFAPEMIEPEGSNKVVCHNCGCGC